MDCVVMGKYYKHFTLDERCRLAAYLEMGLSKKAIARRLGCHRSAIYRELSRNCNANGAYKPTTATARAMARKQRGSQIDRSAELKQHVEDRPRLLQPVS